MRACHVKSVLCQQSQKKKVEKTFSHAALTVSINIVLPLEKLKTYWVSFTFKVPIKEARQGKGQALLSCTKVLLYAAGKFNVLMLILAPLCSIDSVFWLFSTISHLILTSGLWLFLLGKFCFYSSLICLMILNYSK